MGLKVMISMTISVVLPGLAFALSAARSGRNLLNRGRMYHRQVVLGRPLKGDPSEPYLWLSENGTSSRGSICARVPLILTPVCRSMQ